MFLIKNDVDLLTESGFQKINNFCRCLEFGRISNEQNEDCLDYIKDPKESFLEEIPSE